MAHNYDVGTKAWQPDATEGWIASEVVSKTQDGDKYILVFELANGEVSFIWTCRGSRYTDSNRQKPLRRQQRSWRMTTTPAFLRS
jgi:myosin-5